MSKKVVIRLDDLGYTEGVTLGMLAVHQKQPKVSIAFMVNEDFSVAGSELAKKEQDLCLGIHVSISSGTPASPLELIPSLVDETGNFKESNYYRAFIHRGEEPLPNYDELKIEVENQVKKFLNFFGKTPDYIDFHAIESDNFKRALTEVGKAYGIPTSPYYPEVNFDFGIMFDGNDLNFKSDEEMIAYLDKEVKLEDGLNLLVTHPAFLDAELFKKSSLNTARMYDYALLTSPVFYQWMKDQGAELITFKDL